MTTLEDRVRRAIHAKAGEMPPGAPPPLRLPARRERPGWRGPFAWLSRWSGLSLVAPVAAAAAVVAVIAAVFAVAGALHLGGRSAPRPAVAPSAPPRYYVALAYPGNRQCCGPVAIPLSNNLRLVEAVVRVTATGRAVARITPPRPYQEFNLVTAAADDRTFVLAAIRGDSPATKFFMLRLGPGGRPGRLIPLRVPPALTNGVTDIALSPNGTLLAVEAGGREASLFVLNLATGAERAWVPAGIGTARPGAPVIGTEDSLSWTADGRTLALIFQGDPGGGGVRLLDVAARGPDLLANSRLAVRWPKNAYSRGHWTQAQVTPDGQTIITIRERTADFSQQLAEFSARTGKVLRVVSDIGFFFGSDEKVGWTSPSGNVLIVLNAKPSRKVLHTYVDANAGVLKDGHYTPLPWSSNTITAAW